MKQISQEHYSKSETWSKHTDKYCHFMDTCNITGRYCYDAISFAMGEEKPIKPLKVLDVACGTGAMTFQLAEKVQTTPGSKVVGIDFSQDMIDIISQRIKDSKADISASVMDGMDLKFGKSEFDYIFSVSGLIFFPDRMKGLKEMQRVLKPGGKAAIVAWDSDNFIHDVIKKAFETVLPNSPFPKHLTDVLTFGEPVNFEKAFLEAGFSSAKIHQVTKTFNTPPDLLVDFLTNNPIFQSVARSVPDQYALLVKEFQKVVSLLNGRVILNSHIGIGQK
eukprot:gene16634-19764_t